MSHYDEARGLLNNAIAQNATLVATATHAAASKATPVDADELPLADSASSFALAKLTWANLKATLLTYFSSALFTGLNVIGTAGAFRSVNFRDTSSPATVFASSQFEAGAGEYRHSAGFAGWGGFQTFYANGNLQLTLSDANATFTKPLIIPGGVMLRSSAALTNGAAAAAGTLLNAPVAGNPTKWIPINDNGTTRYIPAW